jgi:hypothetical protein
MTPSLIKLSCPNCNGLLELTGRADLFKCAHCSHLALLNWTTSTPELTRLEQKKNWAANLLRPGDSLNWQGGELVLTARELAFVPHSLNFGPLERAVLRLAAIKTIEVSKGMLSDDVTLTDLNGERWGVRVRDGEALRDELQRAR